MPEDAKPFSDPVLILIILLIVAAMGFTLFFLSRNIYWTEAWILLILSTFFISCMFFWLNKHNPQVLRSRSSLKGIQKQDIILVSLLVPVFVAFCIVVTLDGGRYHWSTVPIWGKIIGYTGFAGGFIVPFFALKENPFAAKIVIIDKEAGHKVMTTGPYAVVRHPMYTGALLMFSSMSIALGSLYGFIPIVFITVLLLVRIS